MKIDVVIPVYKPDKKFIELMKRLSNDMGDYVNHIIVMNTEESLWNNCVPASFCEKIPQMQVFHVSKEEFDHAGTRQEGMLKTSTPYVLFMTQDAVPVDDKLITSLASAFEQDEKIAVAYGRQLPDSTCNAVERLTRDFNYPSNSFIKGIEDVDRLGIKTFFCSNVCAMYKREIFDSLGGFSAPAIFNEDMVYVGHAVKAGYKIAYVAEAQVIHSHNYSGMQQFHRNFDLAVSQTMHPEVFDGIKSESEGIKMVKNNAKTLCKAGKPWLVFKLVWLSGWKYLGYKKGRNFKNLSESKIMKYTMNPGFWKKNITNL